MKNPLLVFWLMLALCGSVAYGSWVAWRKTNERAAFVSAYDSTRPAEPHVTAAHVVAHAAPAQGPQVKSFQLTERSGRSFDSQELEGKVWIASFFFSSCPGACWQMNQALKGVHDEITNPDLRLVSITCDPETDTPEVLTKYADRLLADRAKWLFLTGDFDYIQRIGRDVFLQDIQKSTHTFRALVVDRTGAIRGSFDMLDPAKVAELKTVVGALLAEKTTGGNVASGKLPHGDS